MLTLSRVWVGVAQYTFRIYALLSLFSTFKRIVAKRMVFLCLFVISPTRELTKPNNPVRFATNS